MKLFFLKFIKKNLFKKRKRKFLVFYFKKKNYNDIILSSLNFNVSIRYFDYFFKLFYLKIIKNLNNSIYFYNYLNSWQIVYFNFINKINYILWFTIYKFFYLLKFLNIQIFNSANFITYIYFFYLNNSYSLKLLYFFNQQLFLNKKKYKIYNKLKFTNIFYSNYFRLVFKNPTEEDMKMKKLLFSNSKFELKINRLKLLNITNKYLLFKKFFLIEHVYFYTIKSIRYIIFFFDNFISYFYYPKLLAYSTKFLNKFYATNASKFLFSHSSLYLSERIIAIQNLTNFNNKSFFFINSKWSTFGLKSNNLQLKLTYLVNNFLINSNFLHVNYFFLLMFIKNINTKLSSSFKKNFDFLSLLSNFKIKKKTNKCKNKNSYFFYSYISKHITSPIKNKNFNLKLTNCEILLFFFFKPIFFKFLFLFNKKLPKCQSLNSYFKNFFFYSSTRAIFFNNIFPYTKFNYILKKKLAQTLDNLKFITGNAVWYYQTIIRFLEFCSGKKVCIQLYPFLSNSLDFYEKLQCLLWARRVKYYRKVLGPCLFLSESLQIIYLALKLRDPFVLSNWMVSTMGKISFWKFKTFLRYLKYVLRYFFWAIFTQLKIKGIKYQLKGKISVAGNARTRTVFHYIGFTSHGTFNNKILYTLNLIRTFTGVQGLKLWIVF